MKKKDPIEFCNELERNCAGLIRMGKWRFFGGGEGEAIAIEASPEAVYVVQDRINGRVMTGIQQLCLKYGLDLFIMQGEKPSEQDIADAKIEYLKSQVVPL